MRRTFNLTLKETPRTWTKAEYKAAMQWLRFCRWEIHKALGLAVCLICFAGCSVREVQTGAGVVAEITEAVAEVQLETESQLEQVVELVRAGNEASAEVNPYAVPIEAGLAVVAGLAGAWGAWKGNKANKSEAETKVSQKAQNDAIEKMWESAEKADKYEGKYAAHKAGVERTVKELNAINATGLPASTIDEMLYKNIGEARKNA